LKGGGKTKQQLHPFPVFGLPPLTMAIFGWPGCGLLAGNPQPLFTHLDGEQVARGKVHSASRE
jgi:hypothetical protein